MQRSVGSSKKMKKPGAGGHTWSATLQESQESESSLDQSPISRVNEMNEITLYVYFIKHPFSTVNTDVVDLYIYFFCTEPLESGMCQVPCLLGCVV